jgi:tRNA U34 2-thiouridine synthase MnmA/TrmU
MVIQFINYVLALTIIKTNLIFFANYHKNNYQNLPIGELTKPEVREIAAQMELVTAERTLKGCAL